MLYSHLTAVPIDAFDAKKIAVIKNLAVKARLRLANITLVPSAIDDRVGDLLVVKGFESAKLEETAWAPDFRFSANPFLDHAGFAKLNPAL